MKNKRIILLLFSFLLLPCWTIAQSFVVLPLDTCKAMALRSQAKIRNAELEVQSAQLTREEALSKYFPTLSFAAGGFHSAGYLIDVDMGNLHKNDNVHLSTSITISENVSQALDRISIDAHLEMLKYGLFGNVVAMQPLFAGGRIYNGNRLAQLGINAAELQLLMTRDEVLTNIEQSYWLVVSLQEKLNTVAQVEMMLDTLERDADAAVSAGVMGRNDLLKVRLKQREMAAARTQLVHGIKLATMSLCQQSGIVYSDSLTYHLSEDLMSLTLSLAPKDYSDSVCRASVGRRTESKLLDLAVQAEDLKTQIIYGEALPQLALGASYGSNNVMGSWGHNGLVFATLSVPITSWWETSRKAHRQDLARQQAENKRQELTDQMALQVRQACDAELEAYELLSIRQQAVRDAQENLKESRTYFEAGMLSMSDYLEARTLLRQSQNDYVDQMVAVRMAIVKREQMMR